MDPFLKPEEETPQDPPEQFPPTQTPNEIEETKKVSRRLIFVASFLLAILIPVSIFGYSQSKKNSYKSVSMPSSTPQVSTPTPTPDPTSDWKTYNATIGAYVIKYPSTYTVLENRYSGVDGVVVEAPQSVQLISSYSATTKSNFSLRVSYSATKLSLDKFVDANSNCTYISATKGTKYILDNNPSLIYKDTPCGPYGTMEIFSVKNGSGYIITVESSASYDQFKKDADQVLSTFKFTNSINPSPSCRPRPACLDATPRCMIPETSDMCPPSPTPQQTFCTQEAKLCTDGKTYVSRHGPKCEFDLCPTQ